MIHFPFHSPSPQIFPFDYSFTPFCPLQFYYSFCFYTYLLFSSIFVYHFFFASPKIFPFSTLVIFILSVYYSFCFTTYLLFSSFNPFFIFFSRCSYSLSLYFALDLSLSNLPFFHSLYLSYCLTLPVLLILVHRYLTYLSQ